MKTNIMIKSSVTIIFLLLTVSYSQTHAQSHNIKCPSCKYWQRPADAKNVVNTGCVCETCRTKDKKEQDAKRAEDKRRQEIKIAENQRKAKEEAERKKKEQEENSKTTKVVILAHSGSGSETSKQEQTTIANAKKDIKTEKSQSGQKPLFDENITWTTKEENGKIGFGYYDSEWVWTIKPIFDKVASGTMFNSKQKYTTVILKGNHSLNPQNCGVRSHQFNIAIIDREGNILIEGKTGESFRLIPNSSYAIKLINGQADAGKSCEAFIINVETGEVVHQLKANYTNSKYKEHYVNLYGNDGIKWFYNFDATIYQNDTPFYLPLRKEFKTKKYNTFFLYTDKTRVFNENITGFLFGYGDNFKIVKENWVNLSE